MSFYEQISANRKKTVFLFVIFFFLIMVLGAVISVFLENYFLIPVFGVLAVIYIVISYYSSGKIITALSGAKLAPEQSFKQLHNVVEEMSIAAGIPKPKVYVMDDTAINAFAAGRNPENALVCVTTGCLKFLTREELAGVVAHEISHIKNYDIRVMTMAAILVGLAVLLSDVILRTFIWGGAGRGRNDKGGWVMIAAIAVGLALAILTPIIAEIIKLSISRQREFLADASSAQITRYPLGLASALTKIRDDKEVLEAANKATAHLYIANPLKGQKIWLKSLFSSHPPIDERIALLKKM